MQERLSRWSYMKSEGATRVIVEYKRDGKLYSFALTPSGTIRSSSSLER